MSGESGPALLPGGTAVPVKVTMPFFCNDDMPVYEMSAASAGGADFHTLWSPYPAPPSHSLAPIYDVQVRGFYCILGLWQR